MSAENEFQLLLLFSARPYLHFEYVEEWTTKPQPPTLGGPYPQSFSSSLHPTITWTSSSSSASPSESGVWRRPERTNTSNWLVSQNTCEWSSLPAISIITSRRRHRKRSPGQHRPTKLKGELQNKSSHETTLAGSIQSSHIHLILSTPSFVCSPRNFASSGWSLARSSGHPFSTPTCAVPSSCL